MHAPTRTTTTRAAAALALAAFLAACGGGDDDGTATTDTTAEEQATSASWAEADITFVQDMIPHHEEAVAMAELVEGRTDRQELLDLADEVITTQQAEIDQMEAMLDEAGADPDHGGHDDMEAAIAELEELEGLDFDLAFVDAMTEHHRGAITMAEEVLDAGEHPEVAALAEEIIAAQKAEIDEMAEWRDAWEAEAG